MSNFKGRTDLLSKLLRQGRNLNPTSRSQTVSSISSLKNDNAVIPTVTFSFVLNKGSFFQGRIIFFFLLPQ